jgi:hypothetical protein
MEKNGVLEQWRDGVMENAGRTLVLIKPSNPPTLYYSITPMSSTLQFE